MKRSRGQRGQRPMSGVRWDKNAANETSQDLVAKWPPTWRIVDQTWDDSRTNTAGLALIS
jgi:hypothetical protein